MLQEQRTARPSLCRPQRLDTSRGQELAGARTFSQFRNFCSVPGQADVPKGPRPQAPGRRRLARGVGARPQGQAQAAVHPAVEPPGGWGRRPPLPVLPGLGLAGAAGGLQPADPPRRRRPQQRGGTVTSKQEVPRGRSAVLARFHQLAHVLGHVLCPRTRGGGTLSAAARRTSPWQRGHTWSRKKPKRAGRSPAAPTLALLAGGLTCSASGGRQPIAPPPRLLDAQLSAKPKKNVMSGLVFLHGKLYLEDHYVCTLITITSTTQESSNYVHERIQIFSESSYISLLVFWM
ncbi:uncharacterized protein [Narcine bancroftii]|uniref:uncharacterized protein n=1 Tax=Narcine bancroftii TaxID=1343680 RepID=UPI0038316ACC